MKFLSLNVAGNVDPKMIVSRTCYVFVAMVLYLISHATYAADARPAPIQQLVSRGFVVEKDFSAEAGLTGWVVKRGGKTAIVYTTPDRAHLIVGSLLDARGQDLTAGYSELYGDKPDYEALYRRLDTAHYIAEGSAQPKAILRIFFDPNCIYCHRAWTELKPYERNGLQIRWIPVAFLKPTSIGRAAAIMESPHPADAMSRNEQGFDEKTEEGGVPPVAARLPSTLADLSANRSLMDSFGGDGTPLLVWKGEDGKVKFASGLPPLEEIERIVDVSTNQSHSGK